jgi:pimeloyl-ACP methyl ester carboxylesterase
MRVTAGGVGTEYDVGGVGRPVVLLHGFPDSGRLWRHQVPVLRDAGYQVIVPDLRGYGRSDKPTGVAAYAMHELVGDVAAMLDQLDIERAHLVGHDWGAALAWALAMRRPERVDHFVALSVGHPAAMRKAGLRQLQKSWYMLLFQFPGIAEQWLAGDDWANFRALARHPDADEVIAELSRNGSLTPALNWYRANVPPESLLRRPTPPPPVQAPTMGVWSDQDIALTEEQMKRSQEYVTGTWRYERVADAGHWMQLDVPDVVSELLVDFLPT